MKLKDRHTDEAVIFKSKQSILKLVLQPVYTQYMLVSKQLNRLIDEYKDEPLVPYVMTEVDKRKLEENPDYINDIPTLYIKGYDKAVSSKFFEQDLNAEFLDDFFYNEQKLKNIINTYHPNYICV